MESSDSRSRSSLEVMWCRHMCVRARHAAHRADALPEEGTQPLQQRLGQAPALAAEEEDGEDERLVRVPLGLRRDGVGAEEALAQRAERLARVRDACLHSALVGEVARHEVAEVLYPEALL